MKIAWPSKLTASLPKTPNQTIFTSFPVFLIQGSISIFLLTTLEGNIDLLLLSQLKYGQEKRSVDVFFGDA